MNNHLQIERNREQQMTLRAGGAPPFETITLSTLGTSTAVFDAMLAEARALALTQLARQTQIYHAVGHEWRPFGNARRKRAVDSVVLEAGVAEALLGDMREFVANAGWYHARGVPYRRGYLLYGPPGCGKSSFVHAAASHFDYSICVLSMSERTMTDDRLDRLLNTAPLQVTLFDHLSNLQSIILLEDIDAAFVSRESSQSVLPSAYEGLSRVTLSGLLNAIDGVTSGEARLLIMTTNYVDRLDAALIRPGATVFQLRSICRRPHRREAVRRPLLHRPAAPHVRPLLPVAGDKGAMRRVRHSGR